MTRLSPNSEKPARNPRFRAGFLLLPGHAWGGWSRVPHLVQNMAPSITAAPQLGHTGPAGSSRRGSSGRAALHLQQKLASLGFS